MKSFVCQKCQHLNPISPGLSSRSPGRGGGGGGGGREGFKGPDAKSQG